MSERIGSRRAAPAQRGSDDFFALQASVFRTLGSPPRLEILHLLSQGQMEVRELVTVLRMSQPYVSAHLASLRAAGLVEADRHGRDVRYRLTDEEIVTACDLLRAVLERRLVRLGAMVTAARVAGLTTSFSIGRRRRDVAKMRPRAAVAPNSLAESTRR